MRILKTFFHDRRLMIWVNNILVKVLGAISKNVAIMIESGVIPGTPNNGTPLW